MLNLKIISLLALIVYCEGEIKITVNVASSRDNCSASHIGFNEKLASDKDINLFNVTEDKLKRGIKIELGKTPDEIFLKDPTPYDNLFKTFKWKEVSRNMKVRKINIIDVVNENVVVKTRYHKNNSTNTVMAKIKLFETVEISFISLWSEGGYLDNALIYDVYFNISSQKHLLRKINSYPRKFVGSMSFGTTRQGYLKIEPGKEATTVLRANKTTIILRVDYVTSLSGVVVANYRQEYGKHHFWAPSINNVMKANKMKNAISTSEIIEVKCYTDPDISTLIHKKRGERLFLR